MPQLGAFSTRHQTNRPPQELARALQGTHRPEVSDRPGQSPARPEEPRSHPLTDDLQRSHPPSTSTSIQNPAHTRPVTSNFTIHTTRVSATECPATTCGGERELMELTGLLGPSRPLPVQVRPGGESTGSFVRRLARANGLSLACSTVSGRATRLRIRPKWRSTRSTPRCM